MTTTGSYFKYHFCSNWKRLLVITFFGVLCITMICNQTLTNAEYAEKMTKYPTWKITETNTDFMYVFICLISTVMPILELHAFNNKKNCDTLFSMPISRRNMLSVHMVNGFVQIFISYTITFLWWIIFYVCNDGVALNTAYIPLFYLLLFTASFVIYTFYAAVFSVANTTLDGIVFMYLWSTFPALIYAFIQDMLGKGREWFALESIKFVIPSGIVSQFISFIKNALTFDIEYDLKFGGYVLKAQSLEYSWDWVMWTMFYAIIFVASIVVWYRFFERKKISQVGEVSESWLGYRLLGPAYTLIGYMEVVRGLDEYWFFDMIYILVVVAGYTLYRRGFHFKKQDWIVIGLSIVLSIFG